jgi:hypothetical protein
MSQPHEALFTRRTIWVALALVLIFVLVQYFQGRPGWCKYGLGFWTGAWDNCTSQHLFDPYTLSHVLHGVIFYWLLLPFAKKLSLNWRMIAALVLEIGWELLENSAWVIERYRQQTAALGYIGDSIINSLADVLATIVGVAFASRHSWKASIALFLIFELGMLAMARDNLTLNVLMLFFPIEAIKQWQIGAA